jgi:hypothetical protein
MQMIEEEGGHLPVRVFLTEMGVHPDLLRRLTPFFTQEVNRRKIITIGIHPLWIACNEGSWEQYHTEADQPLLWEVFSDPLTSQYIERLKSSQQWCPATTSTQSARPRVGPYDRPLQDDLASESASGTQ